MGHMSNNRTWGCGLPFHNISWDSSQQKLPENEDLIGEFFGETPEFQPGQSKKSKVDQWASVMKKVVSTLWLCQNSY